MKQVCGGVVAHGRLADVGVHNGIDFLSNANWLPGCDLMRAHSLNRRVASRDFGEDGVVTVRVNPPTIADLPAGIGIERSVVEDDLTLISAIEWLQALAVFDDRERFAV